MTAEARRELFIREIVAEHGSDVENGARQRNEIPSRFRASDNLGREGIRREPSRAMTLGSGPDIGDPSGDGALESGRQEASRAAGA